MFDSRYLPPEILTFYLDSLGAPFLLSVPGRSVQNRPIYQLDWGHGPIRVFMWSQMHGNESTTTRALVDLLTHLNGTGHSLQTKISLRILPQLNPDGAAAYTRHNAANVDLNRDAIALSQPESQLHRTVFETFKPHWCFNLHDQRTVHAAGPLGNPATLSFLAPAADHQRSITPARQAAMTVIASIFESMQQDLPQAIARFDDQYNPQCLGDFCTAQGVPTLLFEAGHFPDDYARKHTRKYVAAALRHALDAICWPEQRLDYTHYFDIPENHSDFVDLIVQPIDLKIDGQWQYNQQLALHYEEVLVAGEIQWVPEFVAFGDSVGYRAHKTLSFSKPTSCFLSTSPESKAENQKNLQKLLQKHSE